MPFEFLSKVEKSKIKFIDHGHRFLASSNWVEAKAKPIPQGETMAAATQSNIRANVSKDQPITLNYSAPTGSVASKASSGNSSKYYDPESSINRIKIDITCCHAKIGYVWVIFNDFNPAMEPDLLIDGFTTSLEYDSKVVKRSEDFFHFLQLLAKDYSKLQFQNLFKSSFFLANPSQVMENVYQQLQNVYLAENLDYQFIQKDEELTLALPLNVAPDATAYLTFRWILNLVNPEGSGLDHFEYYVQWPENFSALLKIPDFKMSTSSILEYHAKLQVSINAKQSKSISSQRHKRELLLMIQSRFQNYILDLDSENFSFISLYIFFSAGDDILGASVVNVHSAKYPEELPIVVLSSSLFFDGLDSSKPASKVFSFGTQSNTFGVNEIVDKLESDLLNQIVAFQTYLLHESGLAK